ncbi:MAG: hypothetical protein WB561_03055 [Terracidiphilus sp.]
MLQNRWGGDRAIDGPSSAHDLSPQPKTQFFYALGIFTLYFATALAWFAARYPGSALTILVRVFVAIALAYNFLRFARRGRSSTPGVTTTWVDSGTANLRKDHAPPNFSEQVRFVGLVAMGLALSVALFLAVWIGWGGSNISFSAIAGGVGILLIVVFALVLVRNPR